MRAYKEESIHIVLDIETGLVYTRVPTAVCAASLTLGLLNSTSISLPIQLPHRRDEWDALNFNRDLYRIESGGLIFSPIADAEIPSDVLKKRAAALIRGAYVYSLEVYCQGELSRISEYMPADLVPYLYDQLGRCDPKANVYSQSIEEYAAIHEIECSVAYQELLLKLQSAGAVKMRNQAIYEKFMMRMNECFTREELESVHNQAFNMLFNNAKI